MEGHKHVHVRIHVHFHTQTHTYTYTYTCTGTCACACACLCLCLCSCVLLLLLFPLRVVVVVVCCGCGGGDKPNHVATDSLRSVPQDCWKPNSIIRHSEWLEESATCCSRPICQTENGWDPLVSLVDLWGQVMTLRGQISVSRTDDEEERRNYDFSLKCLRTPKSARWISPTCFEKITFGRIIPPFFESSESDRFFKHLHDSNSIFRAGWINSENIMGCIVMEKRCPQVWRRRPPSRRRYFGTQSKNQWCFLNDTYIAILW